jgi:hypothetical protein
MYKNGLRVKLSIGFILIDCHKSELFFELKYIRKPKNVEITI